MVEIDPVKRSRIEDMLTQLQMVVPLTDALEDHSDIKQLIALARRNEPIGWNSLYNIKPCSNCHHEWMEFAHLLTLIYNRDQTPKRYTIIRIEII